MAEPEYFGKRTFFLYPHLTIKEDIIKDILKHEYEVYFLYDHKKAFNLFLEYPQSIVFINIDSTLKEPEWDEYIRTLLNHERTKNLKVGILTFHDNKALAKKYLMEIMVPCGFIVLKSGVDECSARLIKTLEVNEAKGRRKYVRAKCGNSDLGSFNIIRRNDLISGTIMDISSVGMTVVFTTPLSLKQNEILNDMQLRLRGIPTKVNGVMAGMREIALNPQDASSNAEKTTQYLILFLKNLKTADKEKIYAFIHHCLQEDIEKIQNKIQQETAAKNIKAVAEVPKS